jgi:hypothetical protein
MLFPLAEGPARGHCWQLDRQYLQRRRSARDFSRGQTQFQRPSTVAMAGTSRGRTTKVSSRMPNLCQARCARSCALRCDSAPAWPGLIGARQESTMRSLSTILLTSFPKNYLHCTSFFVDSVHESDCKLLCTDQYPWYSSFSWKLTHVSLMTLRHGIKVSLG